MNFPTSALHLVPVPALAVRQRERALDGSLKVSRHSRGADGAANRTSGVGRADELGSEVGGAPAEVGNDRRLYLLGLARGARSGDAESAAELIGELGHGLLRCVRKVLGDHPDVDDVTQEATLAVLSGLKRHAGQDIEAFADRVAFQTALDALRRLQPSNGWIESEDQDLDSVSDENMPSPLACTLANQRRNSVLDILGTLSKPMADTLALRFGLGLTIKELAEVFDVSPNTVRSRLRLATAKLRRQYWHRGESLWSETRTGTE